MLGRLKIQENILSMKIRVNKIELQDAKCFDYFSGIIFNCITKILLFLKSWLYTVRQLVLFSTT